MRNPVTGKVCYGERILAYIIEYQKTGNPQMWHNVLSRFGKLMMRMIWQERKKHSELAQIPNQELYHIATICLERAMREFDAAKHPIEVFPRVLQGLIKHEVRKIVTDKQRYLESGVEAAAFENHRSSMERANEAKDYIAGKLDLRAAIRSLKRRRGKNRIPSMQWEAFTMWGKGATLTEIGDKYGRSKARVGQWMGRIVEKLRQIMVTDGRKGG